jgi:hypothetical protein
MIILHSKPIILTSGEQKMIMCLFHRDNKIHYQL